MAVLLELKRKDRRGTGMQTSPLWTEETLATTAGMFGTWPVMPTRARALARNASSSAVVAWVVLANRDARADFSPERKNHPIARRPRDLTCCQGLSRPLSMARSYQRTRQLSAAVGTGQVQRGA